MSRTPCQKAREAYDACIAEGLTQAQTARRLGVTREAVRLYAARHNLTFRSGAGAGWKVSRADYTACAESGMSIADTARKLGVHVGSVRAYAKRNGLTFMRGKPSPKPQATQ